MWDLITHDQAHSHHINKNHFIRVYYILSGTEIEDITICSKVFRLTYVCSGSSKIRIYRTWWAFTAFSYCWFLSFLFLSHAAVSTDNRGVNGHNTTASPAWTAGWAAVLLLKCPYLYTTAVSNKFKADLIFSPKLNVFPHDGPWIQSVCDCTIKLFNSVSHCLDCLSSS